MLRLFFALFALVLMSGLMSRSAYADGFASGSEFQMTDLSGELTVFCHGNNDPYNPGPDYAHFYCDANILDPSESDYFVTDESVNATKVTLTNRGGRREVSKSSDYNAATKRSKNRFNLWISSVFQTPLLNPGMNTIDYELKNGREVVKRGRFTVNVTEQPSRRCPHRSMSSWNDSDCRMRGAMCDRYFAQENYCQ